MKLFNEAAELGSSLAHFNLGVIYLDATNKETFSFGKAYDHFKKASLSGNTVAAYNIAVMHYLGIGTFKSCQVA
jgi:TPR repeat protein